MSDPKNDPALFIAKMAAGLKDEFAPGLAEVIAENNITQYLKADLVERGQIKARTQRMLSLDLIAANKSLLTAYLEIIEQIDSE